MTSAKHRGIKKAENIYDEIADVYEGVYSTSKIEDTIKAENRFLKKLMTQHYEGKKVLDAGCGTGFLIDLLDLPSDNYFGIDISNNMLEKAKIKYPDYIFCKKNFMDIELSNAFDFVLSVFSVSDYIGNISIKKSYNLLKNNGVFMGTFINSEQDFTMECLDKTGNKYDLYKYTYEELEHQLFKAGFLWYYVISIAKVPEITDVMNMEDYLENNKHKLNTAKYFFVIAEKDET